jgi:phosphopantetheinyl transferase
MLQLLPGAGRLRVPQLAQVEVLCDAEDVLIWSVAVTPAIESLKIWEFDSKRVALSARRADTRERSPPA